MPGVVEIAVVGIPYPDFSEGVTAVVVRRSDSNVDEAAILAVLQRRFARYKQPKRVMFVDDLPRNTMGKVQKNILCDPYVDLYRGLTEA